jgi:hypothetical protein
VLCEAVTEQHLRCLAATDQETLEGMCGAIVKLNHQYKVKGEWDSKRFMFQHLACQGR